MRSSIKRAILIAPLATTITFGSVATPALAASVDEYPVHLLKTTQKILDDAKSNPTKVDVNKDGIADAHLYLLPTTIDYPGGGPKSIDTDILFADRDLDGILDFSAAINPGSVDSDGDGVADRDITTVRVDTDGDGVSDNDALVRADGLDTLGFGVGDEKTFTYGIDVDGDGDVEPKAKYLPAGLDIDFDGVDDIPVLSLALDRNGDTWFDHDVSSVFVDTNEDGLIDAEARFLPGGGVDLDGDGAVNEIPANTRADLNGDRRVSATDGNVHLVDNGYDLGGNGQADFGYGSDGAAFSLPNDGPGSVSVEWSELLSPEVPGDTEEEPVEEIPTEEAPVEEAPVEEAPVEEAPVEEAPVEKDLVEENPTSVVDAEEEDKYMETCSVVTTQADGTTSTTETTREADDLDNICAEEQALVDQFNSDIADAVVETEMDAEDDTDVVTAATDLAPLDETIVDAPVASGEVGTLADTGAPVSLGLFAGLLTMIGAGSLLSRKRIAVRA